MTPAMSEDNRSVFVVGGTSQAKLCREILKEDGYFFPFVFDLRSVEKPWQCSLIHEPESIESYAASCKYFIVCIGGGRGADRQRYAEKLSKLGLQPLSAIHPASYVARSASVGVGAQIMMRSVVSEYVEIGSWCLLNTNCSIDHDCALGNAVHVMPGAVLAGCVTVGDRSTIGSNATILPRIKIGCDCFVGAGAVVTKDVPDGSVVVGNPARIKNPV